MILGFIEHDRGAINKLSLEMLIAGRKMASEMGTSLEAVLIGEDARGLAVDLGDYGISTVHLILHEELTDYVPEAWAQSIVQLIESLSPEVVMAAGSDRSHEVMAHVAARTDLTMAANCLEITTGDVFELTRVRWGGSLLEDATLSGDTKLLTIAAHAFEAEEAPISGAVTVNEVQAELSEKDFRVRIKARVEPDADKVSLAEAKFVVGGGRGVGSAEGFACLEELAALLNGAVGASRVVTNLGWRSHADQVGQTGTRIAPDLYIACGISGAIQHIVGCKAAKNILAINTDADAPIIAKADYAVIGDLHEVIPALIDALKKEN
jgi:electron transfer flavoprotein alpha subunit